MDDGRQLRLARAWGLSREVLVALIVLGVGLAFVDAGVGAAVVTVAAGALVATQVTIAFINYRATMRRPWPAVAPLPDEDDDW